jgi:hypothetical protein
VVVVVPSRRNSSACDQSENRTIQNAMADNSSNNNSSSNSNASALYCTAHASYATLVTSTQHDERCKEEQVRYSQRVVELRESILQRTVLIDNVNDLNNAKNLKKLADHLQRRYGPVEDCFLARKRTPTVTKKENTGSATAAAAAAGNDQRIMHPPARVRFRRKEDAVRLLQQCQRHKRQSLLPYPKEECRDESGLITVTKSRPYDNMIRDVLEASVVELTANSLALGYYFSKENCNNDNNSSNNNNNISNTSEPCQAESSTAPRHEEEEEEEEEEWLEEMQIKDSVTVRINLVKRTIELEVPRHTKGSSFFDFRNGKDYATIRFKEVAGYMDLCRCSDNNNNNNTNTHNNNTNHDTSERYSLLLALKHPPQFHSDTPSVGLGFAVVEQDPERQRSLAISDVPAPVVGRCFGYRLNVTEDSIERLLLCKGLAKLRAFGMIRKDLDSVKEARCVATLQIGTDSETVEEEIQKLHKLDATIGTSKKPNVPLLLNTLADITNTQFPSTGFLVRSALDHGKFCWFDALHDVIAHPCIGERYNLFDLVHQFILDRGNQVVVQVSTKTHRRGKRRNVVSCPKLAQFLKFPFLARPSV